MSTYFAEADALEKGFWEAVGWCLQYKIKVYQPGGDWKCLGQMRDEIAAHRFAHPEPEMLDRKWHSATEGLVAAYCTSGHPAVLWGGVPMLAKPGEVVRWWGSPFRCHCGASVKGGWR